VHGSARRPFHQTDVLGKKYNANNIKISVTTSTEICVNAKSGAEK
jgi:hypothetical protein